MDEEKQAIVSTFNTQTNKIQKSINSVLELVKSQEKLKLESTVENQDKKPKLEKKLVQAENLTSQKYLELTNIPLPKRIADWRTIHVMTWLGLQLDLPMYIESFQIGSIDGLMLLNHINDDVLKSDLQVTNALHRIKILENIEQLKEKQKEMQKLEEIKRQELLKQQERKMREKSVDFNKESKLNKTTTPKPTAKPKNKLFFTTKQSKDDVNPLTGSTLLNRTKIIKELRLNQSKIQAKLQKQQSTAVNHQTWEFEYSKGSKNTLHQKLSNSGIMNDESTVKDSYSVQYERIMSNQVFPAIASRSAPHGVTLESSFGNLPCGDMTLPDQVKNPSNLNIYSDVTKIIDIPTFSTSDEILKAIHERIYYVSSHLLALESIKVKTSMSGIDTIYGKNDNTLQVTSNDDLGVFEDLRDVNGNYDQILMKSQPIKDVSHLKSKPIEFLETEDCDNDPLNESLDDAPPPGYEEIENSIPYLNPPVVSNELSIPYNSQSQNPSKLTPESNLSRLELLYNEFISLENNQAHTWLGSSINKPTLTRLKLFGGIQSLLKLNFTWTQFNLMWKEYFNQKKSIDFNDFCEVLGDDFFHNSMPLNNEKSSNKEINTSPNIKNDSKRIEKSNNVDIRGDIRGIKSMIKFQKEIELLRSLLYEFADTIKICPGISLTMLFNTYCSSTSALSPSKYLNVTANSPFRSNLLSGNIQVSNQLFTSENNDSLTLSPEEINELHSKSINLSNFISLLKSVLNKPLGLDKRVLFTIFKLIDTDGDHKISLFEFLTIFYRIWKSELVDKAMTLKSLEKAGIRVQRQTGHTQKPANRLFHDISSSKHDDADSLWRQYIEVKDVLKRNFTRNIRDFLENNKVSNSGLLQLLVVKSNDDDRTKTTANKLHNTIGPVNVNINAATDIYKFKVTM